MGSRLKRRNSSRKAHFCGVSSEKNGRSISSEADPRMKKKELKPLQLIQRRLIKKRQKSIRLKFKTNQMTTMLANDHKALIAVKSPVSDFFFEKLNQIIWNINN